MKRNCTKPTKKKPTKHSSQPPIVIWSNSTYYDDDKSSVASNSTVLHVSTRHHNNVVSNEEMRLREELGREVEKELEKELMDGILVLVRRLSDLKAKQFLHDLVDVNCIFRSCDQFVERGFHNKDVLCECMDAESRISDGRCRQRKGPWKDRF